MVLLSVLLGSRSLGRPRAVIVVGCVLELVVATWTDENLFLVRVSVVSGVAREAGSNRGRCLKVRLGRGRANTAKTAKAVCLVVEVGWVAREGIGVGRVGASDDVKLILGMAEVSKYAQAWHEHLPKVVTKVTKAAKAGQVAHEAAAKALDDTSVITLLLWHGEGEEAVGRNAFPLVVGTVASEVDDSSGGVAQDTAIAACKGRSASVGLRHWPSGVSRLMACSVVVITMVVQIDMVLLVVSREADGPVPSQNGAIGFFGQIDEIGKRSCMGGALVILASVLVWLLPRVSLLLIWWWGRLVVHHLDEFVVEIHAFLPLPCTCPPLPDRSLASPFTMTAEKRADLPTAEVS